MAEKKSYPEEIFEWKLNKYKGKARTKLPHQVEFETSTRVNNLVRKITSELTILDDFMARKKDDLFSGRLPLDLFDTKMVYNEVTRTVTITGTGGSFVLDDTACMVDLARYFLNFIQPESCGACTFCRLGTKQMLEILDSISSGTGKLEDIDRLEDLAGKLKNTSLCQIGKTAANPVLTTLSHFRKEYEEHIKNHKCRADRCEFESISD